MKLGGNGAIARGIVCLVMIAAIAGCSSNEPAAKKEKATESQGVGVETVAVSAVDVERTTTQPATVYPYYRAEIRAKVSGYVKELKADIGDFMEAGDVLAVIDVPEMGKQRQIAEAQITRHQAEETRARAGVELSEANVRSAEAKLAQAKSELNRAEASLAAAEAEFSRTSDLVERQSLQSRVLDEVRKKRDSEIANKETVASAIQSAEAEVAVAKAQQKSAEADVQAVEAETAVAQRQLDELDVLIEYATLKAPFAGVVTERSVDPGDLVREGSEVGKGQPLFVLSQLDKVRVRLPVPEGDAAFVSHGDKVTLSFPFFTAEEPVEGTVTRLAGSLDPNSRTMLVEAEMDNPDRKLLPGMFGQASIHLATNVAANTLPARAIRFGDSGQPYVYLLDEDNTVSVVNVTTGSDDGHSIEILSGVESGEVVVDAHRKRFTTGQKVTPLKKKDNG